MTASRKAQIVALHHAGHSLRAIGRTVGLSHEGVRLVLIASGLSPRPRPRFDVRKAWRLYRTRSMAQVAALMDTTPMEVCREFQRHGLPARPRGRPHTPPRVKGL